MPADQFQTQYGGWFSNLSWDIKFLMAVMLLIQLEAILLNIIPWDSISDYLKWTNKKKRLVVQIAKGLAYYLTMLWQMGAIAYAAWKICCFYKNTHLTWDLQASIFNVQFKLSFTKISHQ